MIALAADDPNQLIIDWLQKDPVLTEEFANFPDWLRNGLSQDQPNDRFSTGTVNSKYYQAMNALTGLIHAVEKHPKLGRKFIDSIQRLKLELAVAGNRLSKTVQQI